MKRTERPVNADSLHVTAIHCSNRRAAVKLAAAPGHPVTAVIDGEWKDTAVVRRESAGIILKLKKK